jgi:hypothetical protein
VNKNKIDERIAGFALGASLCAALTACGGGGSNSSTNSAADTTPTVVTSGTTAIGAPIVGGSVSLKCASGAAASATTAADGTYSVTLKSADYPCIAQVAGGQANGVALASTLHSVAAAPGTTNVTPLTDLIVGVLGNGNALALDSAASSALSSAITANNLASALKKVQTAIATLPGKLTIASGFNPLNSQFSVGDANDALLDQYAAALVAAGLTQADAVSDTASGKAMTQLAYAATAFTTPNLTTIQTGSSVNLDGTFSIAIADPNRGQYVARANLDATGNVTSFTNAGQFTGITSLLGNRIGELCTTGTGAYSSTQHSQYVYASDELTPVTDPTELYGRTFTEFEDCASYGTSQFLANGSFVYTQTGQAPDSPNINFAQAFTTAGYTDNTNNSVQRARAYKYTAANGQTTYVYLVVSTKAGSTTAAINGETDFVLMGVSQ